MGEIGETISRTLGSRGKIAGKIVFSLLVYVLIYFLYFGFLTTPETIKESDSLGYHIPIARSIAQGNFLNPPKLVNDIGYYPAIGESILALFMILKMPLNLFNWVGLIFLFFVSIKLAKSFKLSNELAVIFASSTVLLNSVLRLVLTQTIDIWLAVFFAASLYLLQKPKKEISYFFKLGITLGFLAGVKYSGIFLALILLIIYFKGIYKKIDVKEFTAFLVPFIIFGLFWYLRNWVFKSSPFYPGSFLFFEGLADYKIQDWAPLKTILYTKNGPFRFVAALISEYLIWPSFYILSFYMLVKRKATINANELKLILIALLTFGLYLLSPSWPQNLVSDLRYLIPSISALVLTSFVWAKRAKITSFIIIPVLTSISVLPQLSYRPKIILFWLILVALINIKFFNGPRVKRIF